MLLVGKQTTPVRIPFFGDRYASNQEVYLCVYPPSQQLLKVRYGSDSGGGHIVMYSLPIPWVISLIGIPAGSAAFGQVTVYTINFAKTSPFESDCDVYWAFLHNTFHNIERVNPEAGKLPICSVCSCRGPLPRERTLNCTNSEEDREFVAGRAYSALWETLFISSGDNEFTHHPLFQAYGTTPKSEFGGDGGGKELLKAWEKMSYDDLCKLDWGPSIPYSKLVDMMNVKELETTAHA